MVKLKQGDKVRPMFDVFSQGGHKVCLNKGKEYTIDCIAYEISPTDINEMKNPRVKLAEIDGQLFNIDIFLTGDQLTDEDYLKLTADDLRSADISIYKESNELNKLLLNILRSCHKKNMVDKKCVVYQFTDRCFKYKQGLMSELEKRNFKLTTDGQHDRTLIISW